MNVREILAEAARIAEGSELGNKILNYEEISDGQAKQKTDALLRCYNAVLKDVATNYCEYASTVNMSGKTLNLTSLSQPLIKIIDVTDSSGNQLNYEVNGNTLHVEKGPFVLTYRTIPSNQSIDDAFAFSKNIIGDNVFVYGVLAEYFLREFRFEEAQSWESRYRQAASVRTDYKKRNIKAGKRWGL